MVENVHIQSTESVIYHHQNRIKLKFEICHALLQEDTYEAGIANDMRELEMRLEYELEEQEKRWSSEEESGKK
jgi:hypothetical protein